MIVSVYDVKLASGKYDGTSATAPDSSFDSDAGYSVGFALLVENGDSYRCDDATPAAAVWVKTTEHDAEIESRARELSLSVPRYCFQYWQDDYSVKSIAGLEFTSTGITWSGYTGNGFSDFLHVGDTLYIFGSARNDGVYDVSAVADGSIDLTQSVKVEMTDARSVRLFASVFPDDLRAAVAGLVVYDIWTRPEIGKGIVSESAGTYSYARSDIGAMDYPEDVLSALMLHKRPKVL